VAVSHQRHHKVLATILILNISSVSLPTSRAPCIPQRLYSDSLTLSSQRCSSNNGLLSACGAGLASFDVPPRWALISTWTDCGCRTPFINRHINNFAIWHYRELAFLFVPESAVLWPLLHAVAISPQLLLAFAPILPRRTSRLRT
jgi:hypothetical protein